MAIFTCFRLANRLAGAVNLACRVIIEKPLPIKSGAAAWSIANRLKLHCSGVGIQGALGTAALLECRYHCTQTTLFAVMLYEIPVSCSV